MTFGRFDENNPKLSCSGLDADKYYVLAARIGSAVGSVPLEIFVNDAEPRTRDVSGQ